MWSTPVPCETESVKKHVRSPSIYHEHLASAYSRPQPAETVFPLAHTRVPITALVLDQGPAAPLQKGRRARCPKQQVYVQIV